LKRRAVALAALATVLLLKPVGALETIELEPCLEVGEAT
jgi:hypothetical protein